VHRVLAMSAKGAVTLQAVANMKCVNSSLFNLNLH